MTPDLLARSLEEFLADSRDGVVMEEGQIIFSLGSARYSVSADRGRCLLHIWSEERNLVREVVDSEARNGSLRLSVRRFAQARPHVLQICRDRDQRTNAARGAARSQYLRTLEGVLLREFPGWTLEKLSTSMNLERSFSPVYTRGLLRKGRNCIAVLGVNPEETQASIDAALTFALLWLHDCRQREAGSAVVEGLRIYAPSGASATLQVRISQLNHESLRFQLLELDEDLAVTEKNCSLAGSLDSRLLNCASDAEVHSRFGASIARIHAITTEAELAVLSPAEISFRLYGLEFARARLASDPGSFRTREEIVFGFSGIEHLLNHQNEDFFQDFVNRVVAHRNATGDKNNPVWRMYPERWLESLVVKDVAAVDSHLDPVHVYSQVPAFSSSDRSLIDVLTCTQDQRLAVLELKADEDIHLAVQGLDYWARVRWHHERGDFQKHGYFPGVELSPELPLLLLVAPALRVHPAVETVLHYFSPDIRWTLVGLDERWRERVKVIFRKASARAIPADV
jgi:hypothetical protein